ncbi:hypothetical protein DFS34DRAFT_627114 [Phlyctochytrium arcticum]|nr:hypothetical protein DFS34DRAFT_627114 [Phlyctochytrium arcticum]
MADAQILPAMETPQKSKSSSIIPTPVQVNTGRVTRRTTYPALPDTPTPLNLHARSLEDLSLPGTPGTPIRTPKVGRAAEPSREGRPRGRPTLAESARRKARKAMENGQPRGRSQSVTEDQKHKEDLPAEEKSYRDFFPDLDVNMALPILILPGPCHSATDPAPPSSLPTTPSAVLSRQEHILPIPSLTPSLQIPQQSIPNLSTERVIPPSSSEAVHVSLNNTTPTSILDKAITGSHSSAGEEQLLQNDANVEATPAQQLGSDTPFPPTLNGDVPAPAASPQGASVGNTDSEAPGEERPVSDTVLMKPMSRAVMEQAAAEVDFVVGVLDELAEPTLSKPLANEERNGQQAIVHMLKDACESEERILEAQNASDAVNGTTAADSDSTAQQEDPFYGILDMLELPALPPAPLSLPKTAFRSIPPDDSEEFAGREKFRLPHAYIRHSEPSEDELAQRVEYDMDEQDMEWLTAMNEDRRQESLGMLGEDYFERVMDILEKEWFDLTKDIPTAREDEEDPVCAVCDDGECENANAIVFCDGCNIAVHQDCYGIPYIPEGQWLCRKCMLSPHKPVDCVLCPHKEGAFKQTSGQSWAHLLCAMWIPECTVGNYTLMEPIVDIEKIPRGRWKLQCYLCHLKGGAPIQCGNKNCYTPFHPTCARKAKLYMKMRSPYGSEQNALKVYCDRHTPQEYRATVDVEAGIAAFQQELKDRKQSAAKGYRRSGVPEEAVEDRSSQQELRKRKRKNPLRITDDEDSDAGDNEPLSMRRKRKRPQDGDEAVSSGAEGDADDVANTTPHPLSMHFGPPVPVIPQYILNRILDTLREEHREQKRKGDFERKNRDFIIQVCKYWSLKRESRRGAPLLKRLHLEPWTASASALKEDEEARAKRNQTAIIIRQDLERVRLLAELVRKREKEKLKQLQAGISFCEYVFYPVTRYIRPVFDRIRSWDEKAYFAEPVTDELAPDYSTFVKTPMDFRTMAQKLEVHAYKDFNSFKTDVELIWQNCKLYNKPDTPYWKFAHKLEKKAEPVLEELKAQLAGLPVDPETGILNVTPRDFISVLWSYWWPEGKPIEMFPKEVVEPPDDEVGNDKENAGESRSRNRKTRRSLQQSKDEHDVKEVINEEHFQPVRLTRARLAALELIEAQLRTPPRRKSGQFRKRKSNEPASAPPASRVEREKLVDSPKTPSHKKGKYVSGPDTAPRQRDKVPPAPRAEKEKTVDLPKTPSNKNGKTPSRPATAPRQRDRTPSAPPPDIPKEILDLHMRGRTMRKAAQVATQAVSAIVTPKTLKKTVKSVREPSPLSEREQRALKRRRDSEIPFLSPVYQQEVEPIPTQIIADPIEATPVKKASTPRSRKGRRAPELKVATELTPTVIASTPEPLETIKCSLITSEDFEPEQPPARSLRSTPQRQAPKPRIQKTSIPTPAVPNASDSDSAFSNATPTSSRPATSILSGGDIEGDRGADSNSPKAFGYSLPAFSPLDLEQNDDMRDIIGVELNSE